MTDSPADDEGALTHAGAVGETRRLTLFFADLVDSTALSTQVEPETYRLVVGRYREQVVRIVSAYHGHIGSTKGDGLLAVFGDPHTRDDDAHCAVQSGMEIMREVLRLSNQSQRRFGFGVNVRVGVHWGLVYRGADERDFSGLAANVATGISGVAPPGAVVVSDAVETLIRNDFELEACAPAAVKGVRDDHLHRPIGGKPLAGATRHQYEQPAVGNIQE